MARTKRVLLVVLVALSLLFSLSGSSNAYSPKSAVIFKNEGCGHCGPYVKQLTALFDSIGVSYQVKDMVNNAGARNELAKAQDALGVPFLLQGHLVTIIDGKYALEGHVPLSKVKLFLATEADRYAKFVVYQDSMTGEPEEFQVMNDKNEVKACLPEQSAGECDAKQKTRAVGTTTQYKGVGVNEFETAFTIAIVVIPLAVLGVHYYQERRRKPEGGQV